MWIDTAKLIGATTLLATVAIACGGGHGRVHDRATGEAPSPEAEEAPATQPADEENAASESTSGGHHLGEPLDNPEHYYGLYANPAAPDRQWFVTAAKRPPYAEQAPEVPPGYLAVGAMFGDVEPWHMKTISETEFEQAWVSDLQPEPAAVVFELEGDGRAVAMRFSDEQHSSEGRLERQGDLPEDWQ